MKTSIQLLTNSIGLESLALVLIWVGVFLLYNFGLPQDIMPQICALSESKAFISDFGRDRRCLKAFLVTLFEQRIQCKL
ncbi:hypothetical protein P5673_023393 [Acropora cervicornis]|uniref:Uncharacterized protein n=1 Tax=Acropora cervicornis TaxID=6130 RepID=A0AAD9Q5D6_ACRCE|nr:hypothetical protein P5673_023393 [Acropora cervicornis]